MSLDPRQQRENIKAIAQQADAAFNGSFAMLKMLATTGRITAEEATTVADIMAAHLDLGRQFDLEKAVQSFLPDYHTPQRRELAERGLGGIRL